MHIGNLTIQNKACLAPMAGITDTPFRLMAKTFGAGLVFSELVSAEGIARRNEKTLQLLRFLPEERPIGIQLFGTNPEAFRKAVPIVLEFSPDWIDLNFGCPAKKVVKRGAGSALLKNLSQIQAIAEAVVSISPVPVTAKIRTGWDSKQIVAVEVAQLLQQVGISAITVHARTKEDGFKNRADWSTIRAVREAVSIPVIGNGDVYTPQDAKRMIEETGCDMVMIGRGALGRPWIFQHIQHFLDTGRLLEDPPFSERIDICLRHYQLALKYLPKQRAVFEMRKHVGWYLKSIPGAKEFRQKVFQLTSPQQVIEQLQAFRKKNFP